MPDDDEGPGPGSGAFEVLVREGGFEPPRPFGHCDLNAARLPFRHSRMKQRKGYPTPEAGSQSAVRPTDVLVAVTLPAGRHPCTPATGRYARRHRSGGV